MQIVLADQEGLDAEKSEVCCQNVRICSTPPRDTMSASNQCIHIYWNAQHGGVSKVDNSSAQHPKVVCT